MKNNIKYRIGYLKYEISETKLNIQMYFDTKIIKNKNNKQEMFNYGCNKASNMVILQSILCIDVK